MARDIVNIINSLDVNNYAIPEKDWTDMEIGELSNGDKIILAINNNSNIFVVSRDKGLTWEEYQFRYADNWSRIAWSPTLKRFCIIAYDTSNYILSAPITNLSGDLDALLNFELRNFKDCPSLLEIIPPKAKWSDLIWASKSNDPTIDAINYDNFILTARESPYIFVSVIENGDIVDWKPTTRINNEQALMSYNWEELISSNIELVETRTADDMQFLALGLDSSYTNGIIGESKWGYNGNVWEIHNLPFASEWKKIGYHPKMFVTVDDIRNGVLTDMFVYAISKNGDITYTSNFNTWVSVSTTIDAEHHLSNLTADKVTISNDTVINYILSATVLDENNSITVANDTERFALTSALVSEGTIVIVTSTGNMYRVIDLADLGTEDGYALYFQFTIAQLTEMLEAMPTSLLITYDEIKTYLIQISQLTHDDVTTTVLDILKSLRHITQMNVPDNYKSVTVANDTERFALTADRVTVDTIVRVTDDTKLYKVVDISKLNSADGYEPFGIPFYTLSKSVIRNYLPELSDAQLDYSLTYLQNTGNYPNLTDEDKAQYIKDIHDKSGIEGTGVNIVPESIVDGMLDYIMMFYQNPSYNGTSDTRKYMYGIEDENRFDSNYAENTIFQNLYTDVLNDIQYNMYTKITQPIIDYVIRYILANQADCINTDIENRITANVKAAVIEYIQTKTKPDGISQETIDELIANLADQVLTNPAYADIINKIKAVEISNIISADNVLTWNNLVFLNSQKCFIALSNLNVIAKSVDLKNWTYLISGLYKDFADIKYIEDNVNLYVAALNNTKYIIYSTDLMSWKSATVDNSIVNNINMIEWSAYIKRLCVASPEASPNVYFAEFYDNNGVMDVKWETAIFEHAYEIKQLQYNTLSHNFSILTSGYDIFISNISNYNYMWHTVELANEKIELFAVDKYSGDYCGFTRSANIVIATSADENQWLSRKINAGLDTMLATGIVTTTTSSGVTNNVPNVAILQKYGQYKTTTDLINLICRTINTVNNWVSICWSPDLQRYCAIDISNNVILFDAVGSIITYVKLPYVSTEITDVTWLSGTFKMFMAVTKNNEYLVSENGTSWAKSYLEDSSKHSKIKYDSSLNKIFILSKDSNTLSVLSEPGA